MKKAVKIFLINPENQMLLQLRDNKPSIPYPNYWDTLGGEIDANETPKESVKRELIEEIGYKIKSLEFIKEQTIYNDPFLPTYKLYFFKGRINLQIKEINLQEGQEIRYFKFKELEKLPLPFSRYDFINKNKDIIFDNNKCIL